MLNGVNLAVLFVQLLYCMNFLCTGADEVDECQSLICTPPKVCKLINQIVQCVFDDTVTQPMSSKIATASPVTLKAKKRIGPPPAYCNLEPITGHCSKNYVLWYYNFEENTCNRFSYSGCGNNNRFLTKAECEWTCM